MASRPLARFLPATILIALALLCALGEPAQAMPDSSYVTKEIPLAITRINSDCMLDTLLGRLDLRANFVPTSIRWGGWDSLHAQICPPDTVIRRPRYAVTTIEYPAWANRSATVGVERLNQDSLSDLIFYMLGHVDTTNFRDTGRAVVIFGQAKLDTFATINLSTIGTFQAFPYFAMELRPDIELSNPAVRDPSGVTSFEVLPLTLVIPGNPPKQELAGVREPAVGDPWSVQIYPNPAAVSTQVEGRLIPPGDYAVEVISVNGQVERSQEVTVSETGELFRIVDLHDLSSGYYLIQLHSKGRLFGTYPIIIRR